MQLPKIDGRLVPKVIATDFHVRFSLNTATPSMGKAHNTGRVVKQFPYRDFCAQMKNRWREAKNFKPVLGPQIKAQIGFYSVPGATRARLTSRIWILVFYI